MTKAQWRGLVIIWLASFGVWTNLSFVKKVTESLLDTRSPIVVDVLLGVLAIGICIKIGNWLLEHVR